VLRIADSVSGAEVLKEFREEGVPVDHGKRRVWNVPFEDVLVESGSGVVAEKGECKGNLSVVRARSGVC
jgi:hypothetical protein